MIEINLGKLERLVTVRRGGKTFQRKQKVGVRMELKDIIKKIFPDKKGKKNSEKAFEQLAFSGSGVKELGLHKW